MVKNLIIVGLTAMSLFLLWDNQRLHKKGEELLDLCNEYSGLVSHVSDTYSGALDTYAETVKVYQNRDAFMKQELESITGHMKSPIQYSREDFELLCKCVLAEAGDFRGHDESQRLVTSVILNRVASSRFPNSIREVIYQGGKSHPQFVVAYNGMLDNAELDTKTVMNVYSVLVSGSQLPSDVLFFHSSSTTGEWVDSLHTYKTVQGTVFARD